MELMERVAKGRKKMSVQAAMMEKKEEARKKKKSVENGNWWRWGRIWRCTKKVLVAQANKNKA